METITLREALYEIKEKNRLLVASIQQSDNVSDAKRAALVVDRFLWLLDEIVVWLPDIMDDEIMPIVDDAPEVTPDNR